jgi:hypothetical protein
MAQTTGRPNGMIVRADFLSPDLDHVLDAYTTMQHIRCVRHHLAWHPTNPLLRYAARPDLLSDTTWRRGLASPGSETWFVKSTLPVPTSR